MGQNQGPVSPNTQPLNQQKAAVSSFAGTATFTFDSPPPGLIWSGTLSCTNAPPGAVFLATIGATTWGDWAGNSTAGPVQCRETQQLVVTATGLAPNTTYLLVWTGSSDKVDSVQPLWPDVNATALSVALGSVQGIVDVIGTGTGAPNPLITGFAALHSYSCIIVGFVGLAVSAGVTITAQVQTIHSGVPVNWPPQTATLITGTPAGGAGTTAALLLPVSIASGDTLQIFLSTSTVLPASVTWEAYGVTTPSAMQVTSPPTFPLGVVPRGGLLKITTTIAASATTVVLAAPAAGFAYRLHRWTSPADTGPAILSVGAVDWIAYCAPAAPDKDLNGLVIPSAISVTNTNGAGTYRNTLWYDLIPLPTIT